jgi:hypothetical protein
MTIGCLETCPVGQVVIHPLQLAGPSQAQFNRGREDVWEIPNAPH